MALIVLAEYDLHLEGEITVMGQDPGRHRPRRESQPDDEWVFSRDEALLLIVKAFSRRSREAFTSVYLDRVSVR